MQTNILHTTRSRAAADLAELQKDRADMAARIRETVATNTTNNDAAVGAVLLALLRDDRIGAFALKHTGRDFSAVCGEYAEKLRDAQKAQNEKDAALAKNRADYERSVALSEKRAQNAMNSTRGNIADIKRRIVAAEKEFAVLNRSTLAGSTASKRALAEKKQMVAHRLDQLREQYRSAIGNNEINRTRTVAASKLDAEKRSADSLRRQRDEEIARRTKNQATPLQIVTAYEEMTVKKLERVLTDKEEVLREKVARADERIVYLSSAATGLDGLDSASLKRIRADVDKWLADADRRDARRDAERDRAIAKRDADLAREAARRKF